MGSIIVDGTTENSQTVFQWQVGSTHDLQAVSPVSGPTGTQNVWTGWSDGGAQIHTYTVPSASTILTANYKTQYKMTFTQSGLDDSANGPVLTTSAGNADYTNMPFMAWVDSGTQISYTYQANVTTTVPNCFYTLSQAPSSTSATVTAPATVTATYGRAVIDYGGAFVHLPAASQINRIADSWKAHNTIVVMCGAGDKLVASVDQEIIMFQYILPAMKTMDNPFGSGVNIEQLLADDPDIVFMSNSATYDSIVNAGLCAVRLNFVTFSDMTKCVQTTGWILGPSALTKANAYVSYFNQVYSNVTTITSQIPQNQKVSVYHCSGTSPLYCDGNGTLGDSWITACGGINAASPISGNMQQVTLEQLLAWNPDVILIGGGANAAQIKSTILSTSQYSQLSAVKNGKVIVNPMGVFDWSRYSVEEALNLQWVAKTLYPILFANINIEAQTKYFYQTFYGYTLSDAQVTAILNNTTPPPQ